MASIKNFKKELVYTYGALLDQCYIAQMICPTIDVEALSALCDEVEEQYAAMAAKAGAVKGKREAVKEVRKEFDASVDALAEKLQTLIGKK